MSGEKTAPRRRPRNERRSLLKLQWRLVMQERLAATLARYEKLVGPVSDYPSHEAWHAAVRDAIAKERAAARAAQS